MVISFEKQIEEVDSLRMVGSAKTVTSLGLILAISLGSLAFIPVAFLEELGLAFEYHFEIILI